MTHDNPSRRIVEVRKLVAAGKISAFPPPSAPEVAFAGRSNVGKSSLLNALCARRRFFAVGQTPGRTRTVQFVHAVFDGGTTAHLVDLPGYGYAKASRAAQEAWADLVHAYLSDRPTLHLVAVLVDIRRGIGDEECDLFAFLQDHGIPACVVATKMDQLAKSHRKPALQELCRRWKVRAFGVSATTGEGVDALRDFIAFRLGL